MAKVVKIASPAARAVLTQATALRPKRKRVSDGLLPSAAHLAASPTSDHNTGLAADITHDPASGFDGNILFEKLRLDKRVSYVIFNGKIWSITQGEHRYTGSNSHSHHVHVSIKGDHKNDTSPWFPWLGEAKTINKVKAAIRPLPKKENK